MSTLLSSIARLLWPLIREWWKKKNWSAHSIKNLREIHYVFLAALLQFAMFLYSVDHGLELYVAYSDQMHGSALQTTKNDAILAENERLQQQNTRLESQADSASRLIEQLVANNPTLAPKKTVTNKPETSFSDKLNGLKKKYEDTPQ